MRVSYARAVDTSSFARSLTLCTALLTETARYDVFIVALCKSALLYSSLRYAPSQLRRHLRPLVMGPPVVGADGRERDGQPKWFKPVYDIVGVIITMAFTDFGGMVRGRSLACMVLVNVAHFCGWCLGFCAAVARGHTGSLSQPQVRQLQSYQHALSLLSLSRARAMVVTDVPLLLLVAHACASPQLLRVPHCAARVPLLPIRASSAVPQAARQERVNLDLLRDCSTQIARRGPRSVARLSVLQVCVCVRHSAHTVCRTWTRRRPLRK